MKWIIHKHMLQPSSLLPLARGAEVLSAQAQGEYIYLWEMHDPAETGTERRAFIVKGTGEEFDNPPEGYRLKHIADVQVVKRNGLTGAVTLLQWHVFEVERVSLLV